MDGRKSGTKIGGGINEILGEKLQDPDMTGIGSGEDYKFGRYVIPSKRSCEVGGGDSGSCVSGVDKIWGEWKKAGQEWKEGSVDKLKDPERKGTQRRRYLIPPMDACEVGAGDSGS